MMFPEQCPPPGDAAKMPQQIRKPAAVGKKASSSTPSPQILPYPEILKMLYYAIIKLETQSTSFASELLIKKKS